MHHTGRCWTLTFLIGGCEAEAVFCDSLQASASEGCVGALIHWPVAITLGGRGEGKGRGGGGGGG